MMTLKTIQLNVEWSREAVVSEGFVGTVLRPDRKINYLPHTIVDSGLVHVACGERIAAPVVLPASPEVAVKF